MRNPSKLVPFAVVFAVMLGCATTGGRGPSNTIETGAAPAAGSPVVLLELFMDTRPYQEQRGGNVSSLTIETRDRDFSSKPPSEIDKNLKEHLMRQGLTVLERGTGRAPLILSGEIRHFHGQIQMTRLPGSKQTTTSSFLPANFFAAVQVLATLFDVEHQQVIFRKSFLATRNERHSMSEAKSKDAKNEIVGLVGECLSEVAQ
ncbi:MAG: hypothetical protein ABIH23_16070, partial [bacterium]